MSEDPMKDDDDDRDGDPEGEAPRPMPLHPWLTTVWSAGVYLCSMFVLVAAQSLRPGSRDVVVAHLAFAVALLLGAWAATRLHAPDRELRAALALRPSHVAAFAIAALTGLALIATEDFVFRLMEARFPLNQAERELLESRPELAGRAHQVVWVVAVSVVSPIAEELFFRGALQTGARRVGGPQWALVSCSLAFGLFHVGGGVRYVLIATIGGVVFGALRELSGSVLVSIVAHATYNGVQGLVLAGLIRDVDLPPRIAAIGVGVVAVMILLLHVLSRRSAVIREAREEDYA